MTEKQAAWLETMRYTPEQAGPMLRVSPQTVEKVRDRAAELGIFLQVCAYFLVFFQPPGQPFLPYQSVVMRGADCG
jgi:hypothetical protein